MSGPIQSILRRFGRGRDRSPRPAAPAPLPVSPGRSTSRALADALDRAMALGLWEHAERLARTASRLASRSPRLTEPLARLRLAQGDPETALSIIASSPRPTASLRLLRAACLVQTGCRAQALSDLNEWSRKASAPLDARLMLALLEWEAGDDHAATLALLRNLRHLEDPRSLELLVLIAVQQGRPQQVALWSRRLRESAAFGAGPPYLRLLLCSLLLERGGEAQVHPTTEQVELLSMELLSAEGVIPSLVEAQRRAPRRDAARLLAQAIERAYGDLADPLAASEALARLALLLDDEPSARQWVERAAALSPDAASLALLAREMAGAVIDDERESEPTPAVVGRIDRSTSPSVAEKAA